MPKQTVPKTVAYFCAEFGIDSNTPTYAGGLGILAGDTLKEAADRDYPMYGIGLLYQGKYFIQRLTAQGWQEEEVSLYDPASACLRQVTVNGKPFYLIENFDGREVHIKAYQIRVGEKTTLYLLSTDSHYNPDDWRNIMSADYWGSDEDQIKQQLVLGIGGVKLLDALKIKPDFYHFNEGRPFFATWQIIANEMNKNGNDFEKAVEAAKQKIVYTNHTLVRSGNLRYDPNLVRKYAYNKSLQMNIDQEKLVAPGIESDTNLFSISQYAMNNAAKISSVSKRHNALSKKEWPEYKWINITNGVHLPSWQNVNYRNPNLSDSQIWQIHNMRKVELEKLVIRRCGFGYDPNRLVISWARRIAGYKQLEVLFKDIKRLETIIKNQNCPIQILIAGKAHPGDEFAKKRIQETIFYMQKELSGFAIFVPNYDIALSRFMVSGSDIWLNTPEFGKEACGTSGMKAISNGVINLTVADGWVPEMDWEDTGFIIDHEDVSNSIYNTIEQKIVPLFCEREDGIPKKWINMMKNSIKKSKQFSTERMFSEYIKYLYA